jgi:hypothetical protein
LILAAACIYAGVCEGLKANIASASQGVTEEVIFKARWESGFIVGVALGF